ncbi:MAG: hypothetical protein U0V04_17135 [Spirosomataceae bacterium]|jgi:hypothetical protein
MKVLRKTTLKLFRDSPGKVRLETYVREGNSSYWLPNLIITDQGAKMYKMQGGWIELIEGGVKILTKEVVEEIEIPDFQSIPYNGPRKRKNGNLSLTLAEKHKIATEKK